MSPTEQLNIFVSASAPPSHARRDRSREESWLGLALDHWELFDALQDEWLRPLAPADARVLGVGAFVRAQSDAMPTSGTRIQTYLWVDPGRLPVAKVLVRRAGRWTECPSTQVSVADDAVAWFGALPTSSIVEVLVATAEERVRLEGLLRRVSNVLLPCSEVGLRPEDATSASVELPAERLAPGVELPRELDAVHGSLAMAVWGVPRVDPWLDVLTTSLNVVDVPRSEQLSHVARVAGATWWTFPPWLPPPDAQWPSDRNERLWLAAIEVFRMREHTLVAEGVVHEIATRAAAGGSDDDASILKAWVSETLGILRAEATIDLGDWKQAPVGKAIQLVLARPAPMSFKSWFDDLPGLAPAIGWSAAALCGLLHGYRSLDTHFRGGAAQRRILGALALVASNPDEAPNWPSLATGAAAWRRHLDQLILSWGTEDLVVRTEHSRGRWFAADLATPEVARAALVLARQLRWPSMRRELVLGPTPWEPPPGARRMLLPPDAQIEETFDAEAFLRCVATEGGNISAPPVARADRPERQRMPESASSPKGAKAGDERTRVAQERPTPDSKILGLLIVPDFIGQDEERELLEAIDSSPWLVDLKRRVQHYGWRYSYKSRQVDASMRLGPLPTWAEALANRLLREGHLQHVPDQVIVNEYLRDQGISKHVDCVPCFEDGIAMISLCESWEMVFRDERQRQKETRLLEARSVALLSRDARYRWTHEIPKRLVEPDGRRRVRRVSVTFRKVNPASVLQDR